MITIGFIGFSKPAISNDLGPDRKTNQVVQQKFCEKLIDFPLQNNTKQDISVTNNKFEYLSVQRRIHLSVLQDIQ
jgi:hypothetical protein